MVVSNPICWGDSVGWYTKGKWIDMRMKIKQHNCKFAGFKGQLPFLEINKV